MRHFETSSSETALDIEALVCFRAIQYRLVASHFLCDEVQGLDDSETELLALLIFCDGDVFNVANEAEIVNAVVGNLSAMQLWSGIGGVQRTISALR